MSLLRPLFSVSSTIALLMLASPAHATPETGWWWNAAEGGRGFTIEVQNGMMFMAGYMYDETGKPVWYASGPTAMTNDSTYKGVWQQYGGGQTLNGNYQSPTLWNANVGNIVVNFTSTTTGTLVLPTGRSIALTRFSFGGNGVPPAGQVKEECTFDDFTLAKYNAIAQGMTVDQVNQTIGCKPRTSLIQRTPSMVLQSWTSAQPRAGASIGVYFDPTGTVVTDVYHGAAGTTPNFKYSRGF
ncbi:hypothetical protein FNU76_15950 [Chitinimonas arctica]|uniref:Uncharacterized protein n=1 Tax=Chitinimonas arctica TaxID=2594795 RepID=A0A516SHV5_9NEIS|nr:hypothetical protein [Chitinimonas arctica]QDQ27723.1 hypothetical protein FNU76_15950 [Chitinimonas arctica]